MKEKKREREKPEREREREQEIETNIEGRFSGVPVAMATIRD